MMSMCGLGRDGTFVSMSLLCDFIIRVTVCVDGTVELLEGHQCGDELVVGVEEGTEPLFCFDVLNLMA